VLLTIEQALNDTARIHYYQGYLNSVMSAINDHGCNVAGYFAWSMVDNFEWARGYTERFGVTFVDYKTRKRTPKDLRDT